MVAQRSLGGFLSRISDQQRAICEVPATGGATRSFIRNPIWFPPPPGIDWSPDGETIAFVAKGKQGTPAIFLLSYENRRGSPDYYGHRGLTKTGGRYFSPRWKSHRLCPDEQHHDHAGGRW